MNNEKNLVNSIIYYVLKMNLEYYSINLKDIRDVSYGDILYYVINSVKNIPTEILGNNIKDYVNSINIESIDIFFDNNILTIRKT